MNRKTWSMQPEDLSNKDADDQHNGDEITYKEGPLVLTASYNKNQVDPQLDVFQAGTLVKG